MKNITGVAFGDLGELWWALKNSCLQASLSSAGAFALGLIACFGGLRFPSSSFQRKVYIAIILIPGFIPPLFLLLCLFELVKPFPVGLLGIVLAHSISIFGIAAVSLMGTFQDKLKALSDAAYVLGCGSLRFFINIVIPLLWKDFLLVGLLVFIICFSSFSIPLILGGGKLTTLEVLIYEKLRINVNYNVAFSMTLIQTFTVFCLSGFFTKSTTQQKLRSGPFHLLSSSTCMMGVVLFLFCFSLAYMKMVWNGFQDWFEVGKILLESFDPLVKTVFIGLFTGVCTYIVLALVVYCLANPYFLTFIRGYIPVSTSLATFGFLLVGPNSGNYLIGKLVLALTVLFVPSLARLGLITTFQGLQNQLVMAQVLGATPWMIFRKILLPQMGAQLSFLSALGAVWAAGDFGAAKILSPSESTFALVIQSLMSSYHIEWASALSFFLLLISVCLFFAFYGLGYVIDQRS